MMNLKPFLPVEPGENSPDSWMFYFIDIFDVFYSGIDDSVFMVEKWREIPATDIAVFVNGGRQDLTTMFSEPGRIICSSAKKGDSKRSSCNDHRCQPVCSSGFSGCLLNVNLFFEKLPPDGNLCHFPNVVQSVFSELFLHHLEVIGVSEIAHESIVPKSKNLFC